MSKRPHNKRPSIARRAAELTELVDADGNEVQEDGRIKRPPRVQPPRKALPDDDRSPLERLVDASGLTLREISLTQRMSISTAHTRIKGVTRWKDVDEIERFRRMLEKRLGHPVTREDMFPSGKPAMR
jgi:hypothetical protein